MTATTWAAVVPATKAVNWRELEVNAFEKQPTVLRVLDPRRKYLPRASRRNLQLIYGVPLVILSLIGLGGPIFGFVTMVGGRHVTVAPDPHVTIPWTGAFFALAFVVHTFLLVLWVISDHPSGDYVDRLPSYLSIAFGGLCGFLIVSRGSQADVAGWQLWLLPVVADMAVGVLVLLLLGAARAIERGQTTRAPEVEPLRPVRLAIEKLDAATREAVRVDIDAAITKLSARGIISEEVASEARLAPLGKLGLYMSGGKPTRALG